MSERFSCPLQAVAKRYPVVTLTGPRQSGKTTLCRAAFPDKPYLSLEPPDEREFARTDPRGFLARTPDGAIIDEVQRVPELLSYLQQLVDERPQPEASYIVFRLPALHTNVRKRLVKAPKLCFPRHGTAVLPAGHPDA